MLFLFLCVLGTVLLFLAAFNTPSHPHLSLGWMGAAVLSLAFLLTHWPK